MANVNPIEPHPSVSSSVKRTSRIPGKKKDVDYELLLEAVRKYEDRIREIEGSSYWKWYLFFTKATLILTSDSYLKSDRWRFFQRIRFLFSGLGFFFIRKFFRQLCSMLLGKVSRMMSRSSKKKVTDYEVFQERYFPRDSDLEHMASNIPFLKQTVFFHLQVVVTIDNFRHLNLFLNSLESQIYPRFRATFWTEKPTEMMEFTLKKIADSDERFSYERYQGQPMSGDESDFLFFCGLHTILTPHALYAYADMVNKYPDADFLYADHDYFVKGSQTETCNPYFKPDWSPHTLLSRNYIGQVFAVHHERFSSPQVKSPFSLYEMVLDFGYNARKVCHIPQVLHHEYALPFHAAQIKRDHQSLNKFVSQKYPGSYVRLSETALGCFYPVFASQTQPLVSVIVPAKNKSAVLESCLQSLLDHNTYPNFEVIVIDNGSTEMDFFSAIAQFEFNHPNKIKCYTLDIPFNYSIINNHAVQYAKGDYYLFLNNDTKWISPHLMGEMLALAMQDNVGAVGPKLLYPNQTIQHAGMVLSIDETGAHVYSGAHRHTSGYYNNVSCLTNYSAVTGACMMIGKDKFEKAGGFDENLAVDCNDAELCCRLMALGFYNVYTPEVSMFHYECLTRGNPMLSSESMYRHHSEKQYFLKKWGNIIRNDPFYNKNLSRKSKFFELRHV